MRMSCSSNQERTQQASLTSSLLEQEAKFSLSENDAEIVSEQRTTIPLYRQILYASFRLLSVASSTQGYFLSFFLLEAANLNSYYVGTLIWVKQAFDAITDPIVGELSDSTRSPWGRRKPWIWLSVVPYVCIWILTWLIVPALSSSQLNMFIYYLLLHLVFSFLSTCIMVPLLSLTPDMASTYQSQSRIALLQGIFSTIGAVASNFLVAQLIVIFPDSSSEVGDPNYQKGFLLAAGCLAPILFAPLISVHAAIERPSPPPTEEDIENDRLWAMGCLGKLKCLFRFFATFASAMRNALSFRPFLLFCLITTCSQIPITCFVANFVLFSKYTLQTESLTKYELLTLQMTFFSSAPVWSIAIKFIGKKSCFYVGAVGWVGSEVALFFLDAPVNIGLLFFVLICRGIFASVAQLVPMAILPDVCGQYERATTRRSEGLFFSIDLLTSKFAQAIVSGLSLYIIGAVGYQNPIAQTDEQREENYQPPSVVLTLRILVCILPIPFILITIIFMYYIPETAPVFVLQGRCRPFMPWLRRLFTSRFRSNRYETID